MRCYRRWRGRATRFYFLIVRQLHRRSKRKWKQHIKMKRIIALIGLLILGSITIQAQTVTNPPPAIDTNAPAFKIFRFLGSGTNWSFATFGMMSEGSRYYGVGCAGILRLTDYMCAVMRLDYSQDRELDKGEIWMPEGAFQVGLPFEIMGHRTTPFGFAGIATPL